MENHKRVRGSYDIVRLVAFSMVLVQHFFVTCTRNNIVIPSWVSWIIEGAVNPGIVGVGLFFLLSGSLLWRNDREIDWKTFYKKHILKLLLPIWVSYTLFALVYFAKHGFLWDISIWQVIFPLLGCNFFTVEIQKYLGFTTLNLEGEWFTTVILLLYLTFPFLKKMFKSRYRHTFTVVVCLLFILNFHVNFLIYQEGHISLTLGLFYFWIGMFLEEYREYVSYPWLSVTVFVIAVILWGINAEAYLGNPYLPNVPVILLLYVSSFPVSRTAGWLRGVSRYSYIVYLLHHTFMNWLIPVMGAEDMGIVRILMMFIGLILLIFAVGIWEISLCDKIRNCFMGVCNCGRNIEKAI